jgi:hypothetical protein
MTRTLTALIIGVFVMLSCNNSAGTQKNADNIVEQKSPAVFDKLIGTWKNDDGQSFERWRKVGDRFESVVYSLNNSDTIWKEQASIYAENETWVFENKVAGQNEGKSVKFIAANAGDNSVQFSNPQHDFPNDINYTLVDVNTLRAFIVGKNDKGGLDTIPFSYKRVN